MRRPRTEARPRRADYAKGLTNRGPLQKGGQSGLSRRSSTSEGGSVPTIQDEALREMVGTAQARLCPPYKVVLSGHCEERSDEAIHSSASGEMDCFASLAMTGIVRGEWISCLCPAASLQKLEV